MNAVKHPRVLIIEDNAVDFRVFRYAFSATGIPHELEGTDDGESAMALLMEGLRSATLPKLILLDLNLPKMSGMEVLRAIKANEQLRRIPVVVVSSSQYQGDVVGAYESGASLYVRKPNDLDSLEELVTAIAKAWLKYGMAAQAAVPIKAADVPQPQAG